MAVRRLLRLVALLAPTYTAIAFHPLPSSVCRGRATLRCRLSMLPPRGRFEQASKARGSNTQDGHGQRPGFSPGVRPWGNVRKVGERC